MTDLLYRTVNAITVGNTIIKRHGRYGMTRQDGEWGAIQRSARQPYLRLLDNGDADALDARLAKMFRWQPMYAGIVGTDVRPEVMRHNLDMWNAYTDCSDTSRLIAPDVGDPVTVNVDGVNIMVDTPRHDYYAHRISATLPSQGGTVLEIGGGYGGFALQALRHGNMRVVIVDMPETLYLAYYWLTHAGVDVGWWDESARYDIALVPAADLGYIEDIHTVVAAHSLCEMPAPVARRYLKWIRYARPRYVFLDTTHVYTPGDSERTADVFPETMAHELVPGEPYREVYRAPTCWAGSGRRYWEFLFERRHGYKR